ncbi:copia protein [Tanacetum coccineum]|uniref:Copia protein n=1 Tax=Tanacetum coccineum TaxID=301880 RepID=A0ABQ4ZHF3_9ASTR
MLKLEDKSEMDGLIAKDKITNIHKRAKVKPKWTKPSTGLEEHEKTKSRVKIYSPHTPSLLDGLYGTLLASLSYTLAIPRCLIGQKDVEDDLRAQKDDLEFVINQGLGLELIVFLPQEEGIDYDEVFAPVDRIEAIRLFFAYASFMRLIVYQMEVKSAFLYGTIEEEVCVCQPPGFEDPQFPNKVYVKS